MTYYFSRNRKAVKWDPDSTPWDAIVGASRNFASNVDRNPIGTAIDIYRNPMRAIGRLFGDSSRVAMGTGHIPIPSMVRHSGHRGRGHRARSFRTPYQRRARVMRGMRGKGRSRQGRYKRRNSTSISQLLRLARR